MTETSQINPKFEQIIPPLSDEEFAQLETNILKEGKLINPIFVRKDTVISRHNRYRILQKHLGIDHSLYSICFEDDYGTIAWICNDQLGWIIPVEQCQGYLRGKRYNIERNIEFFRGNQCTPSKESGCEKMPQPKRRKNEKLNC